MVLFVLLMAFLMAPAASWAEPPPSSEGQAAVQWQQQSPEFWKGRLSPEQYKICHQFGTEPSYSGQYNDFKKAGTFVCSSCGQPLFNSEHKYDSKTGWPSYWQPIDTKAVTQHDDTSWFMKRTELRCSRCGAHLGHLFDDGPPPTGERYCINSVCLDFEPTPTL